MDVPGIAYICITLDGEKYGAYSIGEDQVISISDTNVCKIENGLCRMTEGNCPKQLCISQGSIDKSGYSALREESGYGTEQDFWMYSLAVIACTGMGAGINAEATENGQDQYTLSEAALPDAVAEYDCGQRL